MTQEESSLDKIGFVTYSLVRLVATTQHRGQTRLFFQSSSGDNFWVYQKDLEAGSSDFHAIGDEGSLTVSLETACDRGIHPSFQLE